MIKHTTLLPIKIKLLGSLLVCCLSLTSLLSAQEADWVMPRTIDGQPDLQGVWSNNTLTPVERPEVFGDKEYLTDEDIAFLQRRIGEITEDDGDALFGNGVLAAAFSGEGGVTASSPASLASANKSANSSDREAGAPTEASTSSVPKLGLFVWVTMATSSHSSICIPSAADTGAASVAVGALAAF